MKFVDTNVFLRYLTRDDEAKAQRCKALFERLEASEESATTSEAVISEVVYVLGRRAHYNLEPADIVATFRPLLSLAGLQVDHKATYLRALDFFVTHAPIDFEDALSLAHMERQGITEFLSYDRDFDRVEDVTRQEP